ncbi:hypothetical protein GCM10010174_61740 [Kutzneria viridogrisea]|uniref:DNA-binding transcriptional MerR regulator n=1 Tax=Kutzneria viridogrisea TaxID=47990 RepID=A0ABR6BGY5_9PSEU|nr:DNA-binding transcriptional MerR regulator [Kutzneria viridogrisea]
MTSEVRHLFTPSEAERVLRIKASTVRSWARRRLIWSYGISDTGKPMYDRDDLIRLRDRGWRARSRSAT